jgi:hypothetical protein
VLAKRQGGLPGTGMTETIAAVQNDLKIVMRFLEGHFFGSFLTLGGFYEHYTRNNRKSNEQDSVRLSCPSLFIQ